MANEFNTKNGIISPKAQFGTSGATTAALNLVPGDDVIAPQEGDIWATTFGIFFRSMGETTQLGAGGGASDGSVIEQFGSDIAGQVRTVNAAFTVSTLDFGYVYYYYNDSPNVVPVTIAGGIIIRIAGQATSTSVSMLPYGQMSIWCRTPSTYVVSGDLL